MIKKLKIQHLILTFLSLFFGIIFIFSAWHSNPDNDMWWMMSIGRYIIENKEIPTINPFVIHDGFFIIVQQWLLAIINYVTYSIAGEIGLTLLALSVFVCNFILMYRLTRHYTNNLWIKWGVTLVCSMLCATYLNTRPTQFTIAILLMEQLLIANWKERKEWKWLCLLPILSFMEINIHASFWPLLFVFLLPHITPGFFNTARNHFIKKQIKFILPIIMISLMTGLLNPNGINGVLYLIKSYNNSDLCNIIAELQTPSVLSFPGCAILFSIAILTLYIYIKKREVNFSKIYMLVGVCILAIMHHRNVWMLLFGLLPILCEILPLNILKDKEKFLSVKEIICYSVMFIAVLIAEFMLLLEIPKEKMDGLPIEAANYLDNIENNEDIILYTTFNNGGYMEWRGYKVYIDARPELFQKKVNTVADIADEYYKVVSGRIDYDLFIEKYQFTHMLVEDGSFLNLYLQEDDKYVPVINTKEYRLYEKIK